MAELDPYAPNEPQGNYLGYSRGSIPDSSTGGLLTDVANMVQEGARNASQFFQERARSEFTQQADEIRRQFTGQGDEPLTGVRNQSNAISARQVPGELGQYGSRLQSLTDMYRSGRLQESHYWTLLDVEARKIRQRYPGFRNEVDAMMKDVVGVDPSNRLVQELHSEAMRNNPAQRQQQLYDEVFKQARDLGLLTDAEIRARGAGNPPTYEELTIKVNNNQKNDKDVKAELQRLNLDTQRGVNVREGAIRNATTDLFSNYSNTLRSATSAIASSRTEFNRRMANLLASPEASRDPKALTDLRQFFITQVYEPSMQFARNRLYEPQIVGNDGVRLSHAELITANGGKIDTVLDEFKKNLDLMATALGDGTTTPNWSLVHALTTNAAAYDKGDLSNAFRANDTLRRVNVIRNAAGPQFGGLTIWRNSDTLDEVLNAKIFNDTTAIVSGERSPEQLLAENRGRPEISPTNQGIIGRQAVSRATEVLSNPESRPEQLAQVATSLFGPNNTRFLNNVTNKSDMYNLMVGNPQVAINMQRLKGQPGGEQLYESYRAWVINGFSTSMDEAANTAKNIILQGGPEDNTNLVYNPTSQVFTLTGGTVNQVNAINAINKNIQGMSAMLRAEGMSPEQIHQLVGGQIAGLRIDPSRSRQETPGSSLWDRVRMIGWRLTGNIDGEGPTPPPVGPNSPSGMRSSQVSPLLDEIGRGEAGQYGYNQVFNQDRMGAHNPNLTSMTLAEVRQGQRETIRSQTQAGVPENMRSSAVGKYQFVQQAFDDTVREMGLNPNTTIFTPQVQDAMAMHQLKKAGLDTFLANPTQANREQLINRMSAFWAALPNTSGRGTYDGVAGNRANRSLSQINKILDGLVERERQR